MADSRVFTIPQSFDMEALVDGLTTWLRDTKDLSAECSRIESGYTLKVESMVGFRKRLGLDRELRIRVLKKDGQLIVYTGTAGWFDQLSGGIPGRALLNTLSQTVSSASPFRRKLEEEILQWFEGYVSRTTTRVPLSDEARADVLQGRPREVVQNGVRMAGRYIRKANGFEKHLLIGLLEPREIVLAWLAVASVSALASEALPETSVSWRYLLTSRRSALVAFSRAADISFHELPPEALTVKDTIGRDVVWSGRFTWKTEFTNDRLFREIAWVPASQGSERILEMARLNWVNQEMKRRDSDVSLWLLGELTAETDDPLNCLAWSYVNQVSGYDGPKREALDSETAHAELIPCLQRLMESGGSPEQLRTWARNWRISTAHEMSLVQVILKLGSSKRAAQLALPLHRQARSDLLREKGAPLRQAVADLSFAKHLLQAQQYGEAAEILETRLVQLPNEPLLELLPPKDVDLTKSSAQELRCRILELLAEARGSSGAADAATVAELARMQPLVVARLDNLLEVSSGSLHHRAQKVRRLFLAEHLRTRTEEPQDGGEVHRIPVDLLDLKGRHPAAKANGIFKWLESWLGQAEIPDYSALKSFVERVTPETHPQVMEAVTNAALALGIKEIEAYVSRGDKEIGVRAYEGTPAFLLIGVAHLDPGSDCHMVLPELKFALGSEMAHLHFKHTRLTSTELWDGVFRKGTQILGLFGALAGPIGIVGDALKSLRTLSSGEQVLRTAESLTGGAKKAVDYVGLAKNMQQAAQTVSRKEEEPETREIVENEDEVLAAYRLMQLTADRVGLVICGDIRAAVRSVFLSSRRYHEALAVAEQSGLTDALAQHQENGELTNQDLAIRLAALCSFYLSDGYVELRGALSGSQDGGSDLE